MMTLKITTDETGVFGKVFGILEIDDKSLKWCSRPEDLALIEIDGKSHKCTHDFNHLHFNVQELIQCPHKKYRTQRDTTGHTVSSESLRQTLGLRHPDPLLPKFKSSGKSRIGGTCHELKFTSSPQIGKAGFPFPTFTNQRFTNFNRFSTNRSSTNAFE